MPKIDVNERFKEALHLMEETGRSLFITGKAGTGKSTLLSHFCATTDKKPVILAPTGVAALNVKGQTIHSFFHFYVDVTPQKIREKKTKPRHPKLYKKLKTIIIDEVSMVRADLLDCVDTFLQIYGPHPGTAFGGVQMIFIGDLYQLPPVVSSDERELFTTYYKTPYFFSAHALRDMPLEVVELEKVYRQKDPGFINLLNKIRNNSVEDADIKLLNSRHIKTETPQKKDGFFITLTTTNARADEINAAHLDALKGKAHCAQAQISGEFGKEYFPTATELRFKPGAQIMMLNNDSNKRWVNGSIGAIKAVKKDIEGKEYLQVQLEDDDELVEVYPYRWEVYRFDVEDEVIVSEPVGTFTQYPFRLAWAVTIHKSQGKTFEHVAIDIGRGTFAAGQMYVALSRCTSFEGIVLKTPIGKQNIRTDYRIFEFLTSHQYRKAQTALPREGKIALIKAAMKGKRFLDIVYLKGNDTKTSRTVRPLSLGEEEFKGKTFLGMKAFCALRSEERMFSVDRILEVKETKAQ
ncbi:MAG: AAA family ATPase [Alphaproteobacteria bacterium]|nr:MAG: AAA family ATPase [Alphaproteobacteria bacterium]